MKKIIILLVVIVVLSSCNNFGGYIVEYELTGDATDVTVEYTPEEGIYATEVVTLPWSKEIYVRAGTRIRLHAMNAGTGTMYAVIYYKPDTRTMIYRSTHDSEDIRIQGIIR